MRAAVLLLVLVAATAVAATRTLEEERLMFDEFKKEYDKEYAGEEDAYRFKCFQEVLANIDRLNAAGAEVHGINSLSDVCPDEFAKQYLGFGTKQKPTKEVGPIFNEAQIEAACDAIDWREKAGTVSRVKNQGKCSAGWAFAATGNIEGQWALSGHKMSPLSEEELVACSAKGGCAGGAAQAALEWVVSNKGITGEGKYPWSSANGTVPACDTGLLSQSAAFISQVNVLPSDETQLAAWSCTGGPFAISVDATNWHTYKGGVMTAATCGGTVDNHGALVVGFNSTASPPYWIVKNSYGPKWGEAGYIYLELGTNTCGITKSPTSGVAGKPKPPQPPHPAPHPAPHPTPAPHPGPSPHPIPPSPRPIPPNPTPSPHPSPSPHPFPPNPSPSPHPSPSPGPSPYPPSPSEDGLSSEI